MMKEHPVSSFHFVSGEAEAPREGGHAQSHTGSQGRARTSTQASMPSTTPVGCTSSNSLPSRYSDLVLSGGINQERNC